MGDADGGDGGVGPYFPQVEADCYDEDLLGRMEFLEEWENQQDGGSFEGGSPDDRFNAF